MNGDSDSPSVSALPPVALCSSSSRKQSHPPNNNKSLRAAPSDQCNLPAFACPSFPNPALLVYQQLHHMSVSDAAAVRRQLYGSLRHCFKEEPLLVAHAERVPASSSDPPYARTNAVRSQALRKSVSDHVPPHAEHCDASFHPHQKHHRIPRTSPHLATPNASLTPATDVHQHTQHAITETHCALRQTRTQPAMQSHIQPKSRQHVAQRSIHSTPTKRYTYSINRLNTLRHNHRASFPQLTSQHALILRTTEPLPSTPTETFPNLTFSDMHLAPSILNALSALNFHKPSPIQQCAIPRGRLGTDIVAHAKSGTGKTLAFSIIVLETLLALNFTNKAVTSVLILVPTRELVDQVANVFQRLTRFMQTKPRVQTLKGGRAESIDAQELSLTPAHIVVGTPGRIIALIKKSILVVDHINLFVMDEADRLVDSTYQHSVPDICALLPSRRQTLAFSATYEPWLRNVLMDVMRDPAFFSFPTSKHLSDEKDMLRRAVLDHVHQYKVEVVGGINDKLKSVAQLLKNTSFNLCIAFMNDKRYIAKAVMHLKTYGYRTQILNASLQQYQRERAVANIQRGRVQIVVATDLLARGVDFEACDLVIQLDVPRNPATYLHRVGRAGRYGKGGSSFLFYNLSNDSDSVAALETSLESPIDEYRCNTDVNRTTSSQQVEGQASGSRDCILHSDPSGDLLNDTHKTSGNPKWQTNGHEEQPVNHTLTTLVQGLGLNLEEPVGHASQAAREAAVDDEAHGSSPLFHSRRSGPNKPGSQSWKTAERGGNGQADGVPPNLSAYLGPRPGRRGSTYDSVAMKSIPPLKSPLKKRRSFPRRAAGRGGRNGNGVAGAIRDPRLREQRVSATHIPRDAEESKHANTKSRGSTRHGLRFSDPLPTSSMDAIQHPMTPNSRGDVQSGGGTSSLQTSEGSPGLEMGHALSAVPQSMELRMGSSPPQRAVAGADEVQAQAAPHTLQPVRNADQHHAAEETNSSEIETEKASPPHGLSVDKYQRVRRSLVSSEEERGQANEGDDEHPEVVTGSNKESQDTRSGGEARHSDTWDAYAKDAYAVGYREAYKEAFRMAREVATRTRATST